MKLKHRIVAAVGLTACAAPQHNVSTRPPETRTPLAATVPTAATAPSAAAQPGGRAPSPLGAAQQTPPPNICFNAKYRLTCLIPDGFVMTEESDGPGRIMTMAQRTMRSDATADLSLSARSIGQTQTLERYMDAHYLQGLKDAKGVSRVDPSTAAYGNREGLRIYVEREYANGPFKSETFAFLHRPELFVVDYSAPAEFFDRHSDTVRKFVESIAFDQERR